MDTILSVDAVLADPRVNEQYVRDRWKKFIPYYVKKAIQSDLLDHDRMVADGKFQVTYKEKQVCKFYQPVRITQEAIFHHWSPEWKIEAIDTETRKKVDLRYTSKKIYTNEHDVGTLDWKDKADNV